MRKRPLGNAAKTEEHFLLAKSLSLSFLGSVDFSPVPLTKPADILPTSGLGLPPLTPSMHLLHTHKQVNVGLQLEIKHQKTHHSKSQSAQTQGSEITDPE